MFPILKFRVIMEVDKLLGVVILVGLLSDFAVPVSKTYFITMVILAGGAACDNLKVGWFLCCTHWQPTGGRKRRGVDPLGNNTTNIIMNK